MAGSWCIFLEEEEGKGKGWATSQKAVCELTSFEGSLGGRAPNFLVPCTLRSRVRLQGYCQSIPG